MGKARYNKRRLEQTTDHPASREGVTRNEHLAGGDEAEDCCN